MPPMFVLRGPEEYAMALERARVVPMNPRQNNEGLWSITTEPPVQNYVNSLAFDELHAAIKLDLELFR
jgi:hypothetical protein